MKIGFFGGCFNPPTNAHINLVKLAIKRCKLDKAIFVPVGDSYYKKDLAKARDRYNMLEILCKNEENIEVSDIELKEKRKLFAIDAFKLIEEKYIDNDIYFIMGADNFINILKWKNFDELITKYKYIVFDRAYINLKEYINENEILKKNKSKIQIIENSDYTNCSSSDIRDNLKNKNVKNNELISKEILDYIMQNNLYK